MTFPWYRLVDLYATSIMKLLSGSPISWAELSGSPKFKAAAKKAALYMAHQVAAANETSWRTAAMKSNRGREIYHALKQEIQQASYAKELEKIAKRNAKLISSVPSDIAKQVSAHAAEMQRKGRRPAEVAAFIRKLAPALAKSRIELIARTEVSKAQTDVTRARAEEIDVNWYQWLTSEDDRVRLSHRNMDKVLVAWSDPPAPEALVHIHSTLGHYAPGSCPNCRCIAIPLLDLDEVKWPCRVYRNDKITVMPRPQFAKIAGFPKAA